ncbi:MAG: DUF4296 domain-containing protein [Lentimicrobiaceae bacterium]|nr:DUF4296 domain-containing protein [Lentimicrobiaceae bacterium]
MKIDYHFFYFCAMNKNYFLKGLLLLLTGCCACLNHSIVKKPSPLLPLDSVAVMIADCYFLEGEIFVQQWRYDMKDYATVKYDSIFEKRGVTKETFVQNVRYYCTHNKYAEKIKNRLDEIVEEQVAALKDSINKIQ